MFPTEQNRTELLAPFQALVIKKEVLQQNQTLWLYCKNPFYVGRYAT